MKSPTTATANKTKKKDHSNGPFPVELQACNLKVSAFCRRGAGYHKPKPGGPGGFIYEKASSRHFRHREVYKSSSAGKAIADHAAPLGRSGVQKVSKCSKERVEEDRLKKRKSIIEAAKKNMVQRSNTM